jgi:hypothetical protein
MAVATAHRSADLRPLCCRRHRRGRRLQRYPIHGKQGDSLAPDLARRGHDYGCGAICTVLQLLAGVSGPILDVFFVRSKLGRHGLVATKAAVQLLGHGLKVVYFGHLLVSGNETVSPVAVIVAIPLAVAGTHLSRFVLDLISEAQFRTWSRYVIGAVSTIYLIQGVVLL